MAQAEPRRRVVAQGPPDLRLYTEAGVEVPYLFVPPPQGVSRAIEGTLLPVAATKTTSGFEVDLREIVPALDGLALDGLRRPFLKRHRLEGRDRVRWTLLVGEHWRSILPDESCAHGAVVCAGRLPLPARSPGTTPTALAWARRRRPGA